MPRARRHPSMATSSTRTRRTARKVKPSSAPSSFKVSRAIINELPEKERPQIDDWLWTKSGGICALCGDPLPKDGKKIETDHRLARKESTGGPTKRENLYLACQECNRWKSNMVFDLAVPLIKFRKWFREHDYVTYSDVAKYAGLSPKGIKARVRGDAITLVFGAKSIKASLATDPATKTKYCFVELPVDYIQNDAMSQPRRIEWDHVWELAQDFYVHPVHEPSNCRLEYRRGEIADLLQFDGQHKTSAQIILNRKTVPTKIYVDPDLPMIQELVLQIQQGIKKRPLSTSDTLGKLDHVVRDRLDNYKERRGTARTEIGYIASQPMESQAARRKEFLQSLEKAILFSNENKLSQYASRGRKSPDHPMTDRVLVEKLVRPLICKEMLADDIDDAREYRRDAERENILLVLNTIAEFMLDRKWGTRSELDVHRAQNFFYQGSISWWREALVEAIRIRLNIDATEKDRVFLRRFRRDQAALVVKIIKSLSGWDIWSTHKPEALRAMRSNTVKDIAAEFPGYGDIKLVRDA